MKPAGKFVASIAGLCTSSCALNPMVVDTYTKDGKPESFYLSNTLCAAAISEEARLGVFFREEGTSLNGGHFSVWLYSLGPDPVLLRRSSIQYYTNAIDSTSAVSLQPGERLQISSVRFRFELPGDMARIRYTFETAGQTWEGTVFLERERTESYFSSMAACAAPDSAESLRKMAEKLRTQETGLPPRANFRMQRSGWDKVPFETTAAGR